jgi:Ca-activated chloride channel homolog
MESHWLAHPAFLWLLSLLPLLGVWTALARWRARRLLTRVGNPLVLHSLLKPQGVAGRLARLCLSLGLPLLLFGAAGPQWGRDWNQPVAPGRDVVAVLDLSRSMLAEPESRLQRAQAALLQLADTVQQRGGHRLGLVVFAGSARVACPLTHDYDHFREALRELYLPNPAPDLGPGTRIGAGLHAAIALHDPRYRGHQDVLLLSDGDDPAGDEDWREAAAEAREQKISVHVVGIGDPDLKSPIPVHGKTADAVLLDDNGAVVYTSLKEAPLEEIARLTHGTYTPAHTGVPPLADLFRERIATQAPREDSDDALPQYEQHYSWFLGPALLFLLGEMALGWAGRPPRQKEEKPTPPRPALAPGPVAAVAAAACVVVLLAAAPPPSDPQELVRQGNAAFAREDYAAAVEFYSRAEEATLDPGLVAYNKAAALYRLAGQPDNAPRRAQLYREAEVQYRCSLEGATGARRAGALYGLGNSLLQQGAGRGAAVLRDAIRCYEQCLREEELAADLADDARHNLELARLLWLQAREDPNRPDSEPPENSNDPTKDDPTRPNNPRPLGQEQGPGSANPGGDRMAVKGEPGSQAVKTDTPPAPGASSLPPIPDNADLPNLSRDDALKHLELAVGEILAESRAHKQSMKTPAHRVKDW